MTLSPLKSQAQAVGVGVLVSVNWFLFIVAIQIDRVTETSLGYYILPLVSVLFGLVLFGERLARLQWLAVALAGIDPDLLNPDRE